MAVLGLLLLCAGFLQLWRAGATLRCGAWASHCGGFSCCGARALGTRASVVVARGLQSTGSVVVVHGLSCSAACGIFPDQGSNLCPLHWQADSQPLRHQGSPFLFLLDLVLVDFVFLGICELIYGLSWKMSHVNLRRMCMQLLLDVLVFSVLLPVAGRRIGRTGYQSFK